LFKCDSATRAFYGLKDGKTEQSHRIPVAIQALVLVSRSCSAIGTQMPRTTRKSVICQPNHTFCLRNDDVAQAFYDAATRVSGPRREMPRG
jgi:hypothetical protein